MNILLLQNMRSAPSDSLPQTSMHRWHRRTPKSVRELPRKSPRMAPKNATMARKGPFLLLKCLRLRCTA